MFDVSQQWEDRNCLHEATLTPHELFDQASESERAVVTMRKISTSSATEGKGAQPINEGDMGKDLVEPEWGLLIR